MKTSSRSEMKRNVILEAATEVFFANGFRGTSVDEIASVAGVSKPTIYKHFGDKEKLFSTLVTAKVEEASGTVNPMVAELAETTDLQADLLDLAKHQLQLVMQPQLLRLRRLVIGEVDRFPELGELFASQGPGRTMAVMTKSFDALIERNILQNVSSKTMASHFNWLLMAEPLNYAMLHGSAVTFSAKQLDAFADDCLGAFLAAYAIH